MRVFFFFFFLELYVRVCAFAYVHDLFHRPPKPLSQPQYLRLVFVRMFMIPKPFLGVRCASDARARQ